MRKALYIVAPLLHRPYGIRFLMRIGDSGLRERLLKQSAEGDIIYKGVHFFGMT
jgi:hypothetical protein